MPCPHSPAKKLKETHQSVWPGFCCIQADGDAQPTLVSSEPVTARTQGELQFTARSVPVSARPQSDVQFTARSGCPPAPDLHVHASEFEQRLQTSIALIMEQQYSRLSGEVLDIVRLGHSAALKTSGRPIDKASSIKKCLRPNGEDVAPAAPDGRPPLLKLEENIGNCTGATKNGQLDDLQLSDVLGNSCPRPSSYEEVSSFASPGVEFASPHNGNGNAKVAANERFSVRVQPFVERVTVNPTMTCESSVDKSLSLEEQKLKAAARFKVASGKTKAFTGKKFRLSRRGFHSAVSGWRPALQEVLQGTLFGVFSSILIFSYAGLIAVETNMVAADPDENPATIKVLHYVYSGIFACELLVRFAAFGWSALTGDDGFWNKLDVCFLLSAIVEIILESAAGLSPSSGANTLVRPVRILRVVRTVRLVRAFRQFHEFQKMAYALLSSMRTLACSMTLLIFVMFFFGVWLTQTAADREAREEIQDLELRYGDLLSTVYTLFLSVSGGISWDLCYIPLHELNSYASAALITYISMTLFGVLNVITSIFVESVMRSMQHSRELIIEEKEEEKKIAAVHVKEVFRHLDSDGSGCITTEELEFFLKEPGLRKYMEALDIEAEDTRLLFRLLDRDGSGIISADEFCEGCLRLKGSAKSIDVHALIFSLKAFLDKWSDFTAYVDENFVQLLENQPAP